VIEQFSKAIYHATIRWLPAHIQGVAAECEVNWRRFADRQNQTRFECEMDHSK
jgi:hypothetical protein